MLTRDPLWAADGAERVASLEAALDAAAGAPELMAIGGAELCALVLPLAQRFELTAVHSAPEGDTYLAAPVPEHWREVARELHPAEGERPAFDFVTLLRR